jgi:hypothetical protein
MNNRSMKIRVIICVQDAYFQRFHVETAGSDCLGIEWFSICTMHIQKKAKIEQD